MKWKSRITQSSVILVTQGFLKGELTGLSGLAPYLCLVEMNVFEMNDSAIISLMPNNYITTKANYQVLMLYTHTHTHTYTHRKSKDGKRYPM